MRNLCPFCQRPQSEGSVPLFIHLSELAEAAEMHPHAVEKCLFREIIVADARIKHGRTTQPIFLQSKMDEYLSAIRKYRESIESETAAR